MNTKIKRIAKKVDLLITDVDGVLTDGGRYYSDEGEKLKRFHVRDGMAVNILLRNKIKTIILTKEKSSITKKWAKDMNVTEVFSGFTEKEKALELISKKYKISIGNMAYIGDDVNDLQVLRDVGFSGVPNDAVFQAKKIADHVCKNKGGEGCFREFCDLILLSKFASKTKWY